MYRLLIKPMKDVGFVEKRNAELLSTILLILISFGFLSILPHILFSRDLFSDPYILIALAASIVLLIPYALSRYLYISSSAFIASTFMSILAFIYAIYLDPGDYLTLDYLVLPITMGLFFQKRRTTFVIVVINVMLLLSMPIVSQAYTFEKIINYSILFNILVVSLFYILHRSFLHSERKRHMIMRERDSRRHEIEKTIALNNLSRGIAHDFNNILTIIRGASFVLNNELEDTDPKQKYIEMINRSSNEAEILINQLLQFNQNDKLAKSMVDLNQVIQELYYVLSHLSSDPITIKLSLCEDTPELFFNVVELKQIILNLVMNAIEAVSKDGQINIITTKVLCKDTTEEIIKLKVQDNGRGIPVGLLDEIFDVRFTTKQKGNGIGLSTVKNIVDNNNSTIEVTSQIDKGTEFVLTFIHRSN